MVSPAINCAHKSVVESWGNRGAEFGPVKEQTAGRIALATSRNLRMRCFCVVLTVLLQRLVFDVTGSVRVHLNLYF